MLNISARCSIGATHISLRNLLRAMTSTNVQKTMTVAMAMRMLAPHDGMNIVRDGRYSAIAGEVAVRAIPLRIIRHQELHPPGPEKQAACKSTDGLPRVALDKHAPNGYSEAQSPHQECGTVEHGG